MTILESKGVLDLGTLSSELGTRKGIVLVVVLSGGSYGMVFHLTGLD